MGRSPCCAKEGLNRGAWTAMEDKILTDYIQTHGEGKWRNLPKRAGLKRCGKSCRLRWLNYLRPDIKRGNISEDEEELIIRLHKLLGNRWSLIAGRLPGRTDNEIKNYWNTNLSKRLHDSTVVTQLNNKTKKKKKKSKKSSSSTKTTTTPTVLHPPTNVIRTKAVRCTTKVVLIHPRPSSSPLNTEAEVAAAKSNSNKTIVSDTNLNASSPLIYVDDQYWEHGMTSLTAVGSSSDLSTVAETGGGMVDSSCTLDFNFLDLLDSTYLSDICFDFDSVQHQHLVNGGNTNHHHSPISSTSEEVDEDEQPIVFTEEMMDDWRRSDCAGATLCYDDIL